MVDLPKWTLEKFENEGITEDIFGEAARLFSENYGVWGRQRGDRAGEFLLFLSFLRCNGTA